MGSKYYKFYDAIDPTVPVVLKHNRHDFSSMELFSILSNIVENLTPFNSDVSVFEVVDRMIHKYNFIPAEALEFSWGELHYGTSRADDFDIIFDGCNFLFQKPEVEDELPLFISQR